MLPQVSLRKNFLFLLVIVCFLFLAVKVHLRELWPSTLVSMDMTHATPSHSALKGYSQDIDEDTIRKDQEDNEEQVRSTAVLLVGANQGNVRITSMVGVELQTMEEGKGKPWFISGGTRRPMPAAKSKKTGRRIATLWPHEDPRSDRIINQLMFMPPATSGEKKLKKILFYNGLGAWWRPVQQGKETFTKNRCPVDTCTITTNKEEASDVDAILYTDHFVDPGHTRPPRQVWIMYFQECPYITSQVKNTDVFNWTATYRRDSDIVHPYGRWAYYDERVKQNTRMDYNYAANKTKKVAWFVTNCRAHNRRLQFAHELQKHISVDIFGACGTKKCPRSNASKCFDMLYRDYKFYLAFENSNCKDYITEKFFVNGLGHNVLPVVMGARPEEYERIAPYHSYIHVDEFESVAELAGYLHRLDTDDDLYNSYFRWRGTGELFTNTYFFCRLCAMLHDDYPNKSYRDFNDWWSGTGICTRGSWRKTKMQSPAPGG